MRQMTADRAELLASQIAERGKPTCFIAPPGVGSTMVARRVAGHLPAPSDLERTWIAAEFEAVGFRQGGATQRPFRAPHHTVSTAGLIGATRRLHAVTCDGAARYADRCPCERESVFRPGEAQLARFGVLLLDELPEFSRGAIEALKGALRTMGATRPLVLATALPCPCGRHGTERRPACACSEAAVERYAARVRDFAAVLGLSIKNLE